MQDMVKVIDLGYGITKTVTRKYLRTDERGRDIYQAPYTVYEKNGVSVHVMEEPGYMTYGRSNARVWVKGGKEITFKHTENAHARALEMLEKLA